MGLYCEISWSPGWGHVYVRATCYISAFSNLGGTGCDSPIHISFGMCPRYSGTRSDPIDRLRCTV